ncbi:MAG: hypothetical protein AAFV29_19900, partial [Myxococcota bacterium]
EKSSLGASVVASRPPSHFKDDDLPLINPAEVVQFTPYINDGASDANDVQDAHVQPVPLQDLGSVDGPNPESSDIQMTHISPDIVEPAMRPEHFRPADSMRPGDSMRPSDSIRPNESMRAFEAGSSSSRRRKRRRKFFRFTMRDIVWGTISIAAGLVGATLGIWLYADSSNGRVVRIEVVSDQKTALWAELPALLRQLEADPDDVDVRTRVRDRIASAVAQLPEGDLRTRIETLIASASPDKITPQRLHDAADQLMKSDYWRR